MSEILHTALAPENTTAIDTAPGDQGAAQGRQAAVGFLVSYGIGLALAALITAVAFFLVMDPVVWPPSIPIAICVLAIAQMGVHIVFFLQLTTGPENKNNILALAFGLLIVFLLIAGSLWIISNLNHNMMPMEKIMQMQR